MFDSGDAFVQLMVHRYLPSAAVLTLFICIIAYIRAPRIKTLIFCMPVPFTCAYIATELPIDASSLIGLLVGVVYHWGVFMCCRRMGLPILAAITCGVAIYLGLGLTVLPAVGDFPFLPVAAVWAAIWIVLVLLYRPIDEPGYRSEAPWWIKAPAVFVLAVMIYCMRDFAAGAVLTFPYAGVFTSYEMRKNLRTLAGQYTINISGLAIMMLVIWATRDALGRFGSLGVSWICLLATLSVIYRTGLGKPKRSELATDDALASDPAASVETEAATASR